MSQPNYMDGVFYCGRCSDVHESGQCEFEGLCKFCKERPATLHFGNLLSFTHGGVDNCCDMCCVKQQLDHARERAEVIPDLEKELAELEAKEKND